VQNLPCLALSNPVNVLSRIAITGSEMFDLSAVVIVCVVD
jgi:hypothetical protein